MANYCARLMVEALRKGEEIMIVYLTISRVEFGTHIWNRWVVGVWIFNSHSSNAELHSGGLKFGNHTHFRILDNIGT